MMKSWLNKFYIWFANNFDINPFLGAFLLIWGVTAIGMLVTFFILTIISQPMLLVAIIIGALIYGLLYFVIKYMQDKGNDLLGR